MTVYKTSTTVLATLLIANLLFAVAQPSFGQQLINVDIQESAVTNMLMSGGTAEGAAIGNTGDIWNEYAVEPCCGTALGPVVPLVDSTGVATAATFQITSFASGACCSAATTNVLTEDGAIGDGGVTAVPQTWEILGLAASGEYEMYVYVLNVPGRIMAMDIDLNGDGSLGDSITNIPGSDTAEHFASVTASGTGRIFGEWGVAGGEEADFAGFQLRSLETPEPSSSFTWNVDGPGNWNSANNWTPTGGAPPNGNHDAIFGDKITSGSTVFTDTPVTVRQIDFANTNSYGIAGLGQVNLADGSNPNAVVNVLAGSHQFQVNVDLQDDTSVSVNTNATLSFNNQLALSGNTLTKTGGGTLAINNILNSGGGTLDCQGGNCSGSGTIGGDLINSGTVSPGSSAAGASVVPEPSTLLLVIMGLVAGFATAGRWQRR